MYMCMCAKEKKLQLGEARTYNLQVTRLGVLYFKVEYYTTYIDQQIYEE